jgi:superfamily II DNA or RNA helicase
LREKWRDELEARFAVRAEIVGADALLDGLRNGMRSQDRAWITSYHSIRPPRSWQPGGDGSNDRARSASLLADFLHEQAGTTDLLDMVVFDEAHYMRNRETTAWRLAELLREVSEHQLMLSATPINLRNEDLFSLLTLIDPDHFSSPEDLERLVRANEPLVAARDSVLDLRSTAAVLRAHLERAAREPWLSQSQQLRILLNDLPTDAQLSDKKYRSELADSLERINLLSHVVTRTRKRDVEARRVQREVYRERVPMSEPERQFYEAVTAAIRRYALEREVNDGFLLATPQRQVTSSPAALLRAWTTAGVEEEEEWNAGPDLVDADQRPTTYRPLRNYLRSSVPANVDLSALVCHDTKLARLLAVLGRVFDDRPDEKLVIFTAFRATASYLSEQLSEAGWSNRIVWGNQRRPKHEVLEEFRTNPGIRVLVSTEVAAEGVDLQFCRMLINYDLPWNPTRVEQRIGRIDRLGQAADRIFVWNLYFEDTIDDRIVSRLLERLRTFEQALGETEAVVGETITRLEYELLSRPRSSQEEQELIDKAALALEVVARHRDELERNSAHMMAHGQRILERIAAAQQLSKFVTDKDLFVFVRDYLVRHWPGHEFISDSNSPLHVSLRLTAALAAEYDTYIKHRGVVSQTRLATGSSRPVLFNNKIATRDRTGAEVIHQFHPLIGFIAEDLRERQEHAYPVIAVKIGGLAGVATRVAPGDYVFYVMQWSFSGVQEEERLAVACVHLHAHELLDEETAEVLLQSARIDGEDWLGAENEIDTDSASRALERAELTLKERHDQLLDRKRAENADRAAFQLDSINRHQQRRLDVLETVEQRHRDAERTALVAATQGRRRALLEKMETRRAQVRERERVVGAPHFVCAGVLRIQGSE